MITIITKIKWLVFLLIVMTVVPLFLATSEVNVDANTQSFIDALWKKQIKDGHIDFWTVEERYEFEQPWVEYILSNEDDVYRNSFFGLPDENDIQQTTAQEIARAAVRKEFGDTAFEDERDWDRVSIYFLDYFTGKHEWRFCFYSKTKDSQRDSIPYYEVWLDAKTGEMTKVFAHKDIIANN